MAFVDLPNAGNRARRLPDGPADVARRRGVHDFEKRGDQEQDAVDGDHRARDQGGAFVGDLVAFPADQGDGDADERGDGSDRVAPVVPRLGFKRGAAHVVAQLNHAAEQELFYHHHPQQHDQREHFGRRLVRRMNLSNALHRQSRRGGKHDERHDKRGDRLRFPVAVGMVLVRRLGGELEPAPDHERAADVEHRLHPVRDQRIGVPEHPGGDLDQRQRRIDEHPLEGKPLTRGVYRHRGKVGASPQRCKCYASSSRMILS